MAFCCLLFVVPCSGVCGAEGAGGEGIVPGADRVSYEEAIRDAQRDLSTRSSDGVDSPGVFGISELLGLAALLAALVLVLWLTRWMRGAAFGRVGSREIRILDRLAIGRNSALLLVRLRGRDYFLAEHQGGVSVLREMAGDGMEAGGEEKTEKKDSV